MDQGTTTFYDRYAADSAIEAEAARSAVSSRFAHAFKAGGKVLDVGAGSGRDLAILRELGFDAFGVEPNEAMRAFAVRKHPALADCLQAGALPEIGMPFGGEFDGIVCSAVLMHVAQQDLARCAASLRALLKPRGRLLVSLPFMQSDLLAGERDGDGRFFKNHAPENFRLLLESAGFTQLERWDSDAVQKQTGTLWFTLLFELADPLHGQAPGARAGR